MTRKWKLAAAVGVISVLAIPAAVAALPRARVEQPAHVVEVTHAEFEVRRYEPRIVAEVDVIGGPREATNQGFRILADYIFGNNVSRAKVSMTAPVDRRASEKIEMTAPVDRRRSGRAWVISFTMPSRHSIETLPDPVDERIAIRRIPTTRYAVVRFSGAPSETVVQRKMAELVGHVEAAGYEVAGTAPIYARYDPPWTPPFLRRNEILIELEGS
jgi:effector-binding domain-containing protein